MGTIVKLIVAVVLSCVFVIGMLFTLFKPTYKVRIGDEILGYVSDKSAAKNRINEYVQNGDGANVGYVILKDEPTYTFEFVKKDTNVDDEGVISNILARCDVYYRVYGVNVDGVEKFIVDDIKKAQEIVDGIEEKQKDYKKKSNVEVSEKFVQNYELPEDIEVAVNDINNTLKENNDEYIKKTTVYYAASSSVSVTVPPEILLALKESNVNLDFRNPLDNGIVTSRFGLRSLGNHQGVDIAAPTGTDIHVAESGIVTFVGWYGGYGNLVKVQHAGGYETYYGHCSAFKCSVGDEVSKGDVIALVGSTGRSTGPHVHFEVRVDGVVYNPGPFIGLD